MKIPILIVLAVFVIIDISHDASAICCFPYDVNYYIDPVTGNLVLNGELMNDSYRGEPFGNANYSFAFYNEDGNSILETKILPTHLLPIKGGVVIPPPAIFPFQIILDNVDTKTIQKSTGYGVAGTNSLDYYPWKPADLVIPFSKMTAVGTISGKNDDLFTKWEISGNITNTHSQKTNNVYVVASLRDKNEVLVGIAGYSEDSTQPLMLGGFETKSFTLYGLVPSSKVPSKINLYAESDESSLVHQYYRPLKLQIPPPYENKITTDPRKPIMISANITNTSRQSFDLDWIIQIKKSPQSVSDGNLSKDHSKVIHIQKTPAHIDGQESIRLDYSWIPQANGVYSYEMYLWDDSKPLSYAFTGTFLHDNWILVNSNLNSIKNQILSGIPLDEVRCREGLEIVHKASNGNLVCVKPETRTKLTERGWVKAESVLSSAESKYDPYNTRCSFGVIPAISEEWQALGLHPSDKDWESLGRHLVQQKFYQELKNRDIIFEPACFGVHTGPIEESYPPRFAMCSTVTASNGTELYLEGTVNEFDVIYFNIDNKIPYQCGEHHFGCLCQFK